jgi:serine protease Do
MKMVEQKPQRLSKLVPWATGAAAGAALVASFGAGAILAPKGVDAQPIRSRPPAAAAALPSFADLVERVSPAVVSLTVVTEERGANSVEMPDLEQLPPELRRRFEQMIPRNQRPREGRGTGSGFFISQDGYIVTNNHVVDNAKEITVTLKDDRELKARVIGTDERSDLAVLKVEGRNFPYVEFDTTTKPRVGDWVIAIGNPFGLGGSATAGIVSADGREIGGQFANFIQIDAPINPGNSGGPAFDLSGRVVGVNTAIFTRTGGNIGIGFAIPAQMADQVTKQLIKGGRVAYGWLGVTIQDVNRELAESLGLQDAKGAIISSVSPGGPAEKGGLRGGDIVLSIDGQAVEDASDLTRRVGNMRAGMTARIEVLRSGQRRQLPVLVGERPSERQLRADAGQEEPEAAAPAADAPLGVSVRPLTSAERARLRLGATDPGVAIAAVEDGSQAERRGLEPGLAIVEAGGQPVSNAADFAKAVDDARKANRPSIPLLIQRPDGRFYVPVPLANAN